MKISGRIVMGKQLGRRLGFPTANLLPERPEQHFERNGVYTAWIRPEGYPEPLPCMLNQGTHPTAPEGAPTIEAHILDFSDDIYGLRAELEALQFLRPETRFPSLEALKAQLTRDLATTRRFFETLREGTD